MTNPVLVEVTRGGRVESWHRGAVAVLDADGKAVLSLGDIDVPVFPRSAVKAFQALPLVESGAADTLGLSDADIALACSSHSGEPAHTAGAAAMLTLARRDAGALECGAHWPMREEAARALACTGAEPSALHNNCSGKHAGFVCLACGMGEDPRGYTQLDHPVMQAVTGAVATMTGTGLDMENCGTDGCSIPTFAVPLRALALGFARFGAGHGMTPLRAKAAERIRRAVAAHPFYVAGTDRFDTRVMQALGARVFCKTGAEGMHCAAVPELGLGIAVKADDGAGRAAQVMLAAVLQRLGIIAPVLEDYATQTLKNWNGLSVGQVRAAGISATV